MQGVQGSYVSIVTPPPYGEISRDNHDTDLGSGRQQKRDRGVCGVLPTHVEISGMTGGWVPGDVAQPGNI